MRTAPSGATRNSRQQKGRYDLLPPRAIHIIARVMEDGADTYGPRNWERGMPLSWFQDSGLRHAFAWMAGETDEDHLARAAWNLLCALETRERIKSGLLPADLSDL